MHRYTAATVALIMSTATPTWAQTADGGPSRGGGESNPGKLNGYDDKGSPSVGAVDAPAPGAPSQAAPPATAEESPGLLNGRPGPTGAAPRRE